MSDYIHTLMRFLVTCSEHGVKSQPQLQYWNGTSWRNVPTFECKTHEVNKYEFDPSAQSKGFY